MYYYKLSDGIFIDYGCNGVVPIKGGLLIPVDANCSDITEEYRKDLHAFLTKWFGGVEVVEGSCVRVREAPVSGSSEGASDSSS